jgi:hypothetical protein
MILKCESCGYENEFAQPYPYHAGFGNQGFLYNDAGNLTLVWSLYDRDYIELVGNKPWTLLTPEERALFEAALLPAPTGGRFRFGSPARCKQCHEPISPAMSERNIYFVEFDGSVITDGDPDAMGFKFALAGTA